MEPPSLIYRTEKGHRTKSKPLRSELTQEKKYSEPRRETTKIADNPHAFLLQTP